MFSSSWRSEYPDANNLIRLEFYSSNKGKTLELVSEVVLLRFCKEAQKEYFFTNKDEIIKECMSYINTDIKSHNSLLMNHTVASQEHNVFNVVFEITSKNEIDFKSIGYEENCKEKPDKFAIY